MIHLFWYIFMENNTQVIQETKLQTNSSEVKHSIWELLSHVRGLWLNPGQRISRWEYLLAWLPFGIISTSLWVIAYRVLWISIYGDISDVLAVIYIIMLIRLMVARLHDIDESLWNVLWGISVIIIWILCFFVSMFGKSSLGDKYVLFIWIMSLLVLISAVIIIMFSIKITFYKWTVGNNKYWHDPLPRQSSDNTNYWIIWILWFIISSGVSMLWPSPQSIMTQNGINLQNSEHVPNETVIESWVIKQ